MRRRTLAAVAVAAGLLVGLLVYALAGDGPPCELPRCYR